jgi:hypothetical protein
MELHLSAIEMALICLLPVLGFTLGYLWANRKRW